MLRIRCSINPPPPVLCTVPQYRKFKVESFPIRIEDDVHHYAFALQFPADRECEAGDQSG